jgi:hypothetical protein
MPATVAQAAVACRFDQPRDRDFYRVSVGGLALVELALDNG